MDDDVAYRARGGASLPAESGGVTATYPLAVLEADGAGVGIGLSPRWLAAVPRFFSGGRQSKSEYLWSRRWDEIRQVKIAQRSIVFIPEHGGRCRFVTPTRHGIRPLVDMLRGTEIRCEEVRTTIRDAFMD
ncbi:hypothetical protein GCM10027360_89980 [Amycolatopsis echigonensis]